MNVFDVVDKPKVNKPAATIDELRQSLLDYVNVHANIAPIRIYEVTRPFNRLALKLGTSVNAELEWLQAGNALLLIAHDRANYVLSSEAASELFETIRFERAEKSAGKSHSEENLKMLLKMDFEKAIEGYFNVPPIE